jgi:hypothetical protein
MVLVVAVVTQMTLSVLAVRLEEITNLMEQLRLVHMLVNAARELTQLLLAIVPANAVNVM